MTTDRTSRAVRQSFLESLREQRWDDHRYYHHHRINQSLHFVSALSFLGAYAALAFDPVLAALLGWFAAMCSRQLGHFFFEPKGYDEVNHATHEHKEAIKVGYNLKRKVVLLSVWGLSPLALWSVRPLFGALETWTEDGDGFFYNLCVLWLLIAGGAVLFRTVQLFFLRDVRTGLVWAAKILTDPFHDVKLYHRSPAYVLRGEMLDPMAPWLDLDGEPEAAPAPRG